MCVNKPVYPGSHTHLYSLIPSSQVPCWQGLLAQSSWLISQFTPMANNEVVKGNAGRKIKLIQFISLCKAVFVCV